MKMAMRDKHHRKDETGTTSVRHEVGLDAETSPILYIS